MLMSLQNIFKLVTLGLILNVISATGTVAQTNILRMATTTSTENSGLLKTILPVFEQASGYEVHVIAVGTGKALRMGRDGDVDVVLVHAPAAEQAFIDKGFGVNRRQVMYNDFVIVGPVSDPASINGMQDPITALTGIVKHRALFVSRGDDSGTNKKELALWQAAGIEPAGNWYRVAGQGMGKVLQMAGELQAYTLTDRGTWLAMRHKLPLQIVVEGDPRLYNPYGIIAVNPQRYPQVNYRGAMQLIDWLTSKPGQTLIGQFRVNEEQLFTPMALKLAGH